MTSAPGTNDEPTFTDLHAFKRDILYAVRTLEDDGLPKGLAVKCRLEDAYSEEVHHSRLYQNLNQLVESGLLEKGERDGRTNEYRSTETARRMLERHTKRQSYAIGLTCPDTSNTSIETNSKPPLIPSNAELTVLFDDESLKVVERTSDGGTWQYEIDDQTIQLVFQWNERVFMHASARFQSTDEQVALDHTSESSRPTYIFEPLEPTHDFEVQLEWDTTAERRNGR